MFAVTVLFRVKPGHMDAFLPLILDNARASLRVEPQCLFFDVCPDPDAGEVFLYEVYDGRSGFDAHLASAHFQSFDGKVADMILEKTVRVFNEVMR
ncbi:MAG: putative quinol monooxygenase [Pseudomonadota bacterium]